MLRKIRTRSIIRPCLALLCATGVAFAQETPPPAPPPPPAELSALQAAIEKQSRQIEALSQQIAELKSLITKGKPVHLINQRPPAPGSTEPGAEKTETAPAPLDQPAPAAEAPAKSEPAAASADGTKHTVAKGETLTSIAKRYNIPLAELEKFNQIQDDRKLQIGQVLKIPSTAAKTPEPPNQPKENP